MERAMIVFEWFYDKNKIIVNELGQLENYKVVLLRLLSFPHAYTCNV